MHRRRPIPENTTKDTKIQNHLLIQGCSVSVPFAILIVSVSISSRLSWTGSLLSIIAACLTSWLGTYVMLDVCRLTKSGGNLHSGLYAVMGELMAFMTSWLDLLVRGCMVGVAGRTLSHTVDLVVGPSLHNTVIQVFGLTPYLNTFPDILAGSSVVCTSIIIGVGLEVSVNISINDCFYWALF